MDCSVRLDGLDSYPEARLELVSTQEVEEYEENAFLFTLNYLSNYVKAISQEKDLISNTSVIECLSL